MSRWLKESMGAAGERDADNAYRSARAEAQRLADQTGLDHGLRWNAVFREWVVGMLPGKAHRSGSDLTCEVVMCSDPSKCRPGHGPR